MFWLCASVLVLSLLLGGGTHSGFPGDVVIQLAAVPLLLAALFRFWSGPPTPETSPSAAPVPDRRPWALALLCLLIAVTPLVQLIPLPPEVWTKLPGREPVVATLRLVESAPASRSLSITPHATWYAALSLLPPIAVALAVSQQGLRERRALSLLVLLFGLGSAFLGLLQVAQGPQSPLRFYEFTNPADAVGFFANRNHLAALLYCALVLAGPWVIHAAVSATDLSTGRYRLDTAALVPILATFTCMLVLVAALIMARSRAAMLLTIVALFGIALLTFANRRRKNGFKPTRLIGAAVVLALVFSAQFALFRMMARFDQDLSADARIPFAANTIEAAKAHMPFGAGAGSFIPVYAQFEKPDDLFHAFANRAHNDFLEGWLESGALGIGLAILLGVWLLIRSIAVWRARLPQLEPIDTALPRAASIIVILLIAHSLADYPLRTAAMMAVAAFACGLLVPAPASAASDRGTWRAVRTKAPGRPPHEDLPFDLGERPEPSWTAPVAPTTKRDASRDENADTKTSQNRSQGRALREDWPTDRSERTGSDWAAQVEPITKENLRQDQDVEARLETRAAGLGENQKRYHSKPTNAAPRSTPPASGRWGEDIEWPQAWRSVSNNAQTSEAKPIRRSPQIRWPSKPNDDT